ncbi:MAG: hypothetical protein GY722_23620 [bacterium]|nr:hypothetical protein [bacterium]
MATEARNRFTDLLSRTQVPAKQIRNTLPVAFASDSSTRRSCVSSWTRDKSLYPDPALFIRELLQNSLDACRYQEALAREAGMEDKYIPRITVWDYSDDQEAPRIVFQDNGIGMSQRQVDSFFLRIGKSFYRSPEFAAEKQRLAEQEIHLDACSRFGIGFLSCFLAGDLIEVQTYRSGSDPLKISITGPSKYFLVERLSQPDATILFRSPESDRDDGPPRFPGTRVTVYLKSRWRDNLTTEEEHVALKTLETFAVNQEYDVFVRYPNAEQEIVRRRRWKEAPPLFCGRMSRSEIIRDAMGLKWAAPEREFLLKKILSPSTFDLHSYSNELRGEGALWMLKGDDGEPRPSVGNLRMKPNILTNNMEICVSSPELTLASNINKFCSVNDMDCARAFADAQPPNGKTAAACFEEIFAGTELGSGTNAEEHLGFVEESKSSLQELTPDQIEWLIQFCSRIHDASYRQIEHWCQNERVVQALIEGDQNGILLAIEEDRLPDLTGSIELSGNYLISLFGINIPALLLEWNPSDGKASKRTLSPASVGVRIDAYGALAPQPSASRLFIPSERSAQLRASVGCAILQHAELLNRNHSDDPDWHRWFKAFLGGCEPIADSILQEIVLLQDDIEIQCVIDGMIRKLTLRQAHHHFGDFAAAIEEGHVGSDGILTGHVRGGTDLLLSLSSQWLSWFPKYLRRSTTAGDLEVDLSALGPGRPV